MSDVFISYARSSEEQAKRVERALRDAGYAVWRDADLPAHRTYAEVIEERLKSAKAVVVLWSAEATKSQWVRAEADAARELGTLIQASVDGAMPGIPFNQIQCADLSGWDGNVGGPQWKKVEGSVAALVGDGGSASPPSAAQPPRERSICVLPFANMSGDAEQEYFSDGISEDITTDLSKVSALAVTARNTAFTFKKQAVDVCDVARKLRVSHVLEGSVRKAGSRVRITAQLIDGRTGDHLWAERYDRDLTDIFAIQDEISKAIVAALKLKLLPQEKKAIEQRGTTSAEAYDLYLMARQYWVSGNDGDVRRDEIILRLCRSAIDIDPSYARAWALIALTQCWMRHRDPSQAETGVAAAEEALKLDPNLAEPHCVRAVNFASQGLSDDANAAIDAALSLDPESWEVNKEAALIRYRQGRIQEALSYFERAASLMETDYRSAGLMVSCALALGDSEAARSGAGMTIERAERVLSQDRSNGAALAYGAIALASVGEHTRAKEWMRRAMLVDPQNVIMRYNLACMAMRDLDDPDAALALVEPFMTKASAYQMVHVEADPDLEKLRGDPRFQAMIAEARARLASSTEDASPPA